jgi:hypothetical protein
MERMRGSEPRSSGLLKSQGHTVATAVPAARWRQMGSDSKGQGSGTSGGRVPASSEGTFVNASESVSEPIDRRGVWTLREVGCGPRLEWDEGDPVAGVAPDARRLQALLCGGCPLGVFTMRNARMRAGQAARVCRGGASRLASEGSAELKRPTEQDEAGEVTCIDPQQHVQPTDARRARRRRGFVWATGVPPGAAQISADRSRRRANSAKCGVREMC